MIPDVVALEVTVGRVMDGDCVLCSSEALPELLGHGATEAEAVKDLQEQYASIVWH